MSVRFDRQSLRKCAPGIIKTAARRISLPQIPDYSRVVRIELARSFKIRDRIVPFSLAPANRGQAVPNFGVVRSRARRDREFSLGALVIAVAIVIMISEREMRVPKFGTQL